jgi:putative membrane protein
MKKETFAAVATLATMMFMSQGAFAQDQSGQTDRSADKSSQPDQSNSSAREAGARGQAGQADHAGHGAIGARAGQSGQSQNMDQKFVEFASTNDQFEIQAARLAERNAQDDQIKQMARQIAQDHQQSSQQLQQAAKAAGIQVSQQLKPHQQAMLQELQQMQGQEFDRAWLYGNVAGHTKAVLKFRDEAREGQNEQIKQFAQQTLPKLQQHLQHAQEMAQFDTAQQAGATERANRSSS